ncbi:MAG: UbiA-like polyprenyltransferase [Pontiellaceae bacterium]
MIGIIYATEKEAEPLYSFNLNKSIKIKISGIGLESARIAAEELIDQGAKIIINPGICAGLHNRVKRGHVYRISSVVTEELKAAVNIGLGFSLKKLVSVDEPLHQEKRKKELAREYDLVDMEGYAIARVCEKYDIPCVLLKAVTDFGDSFAKKDIQNYLNPVSKTLAEAVIYALKGINRNSKKKNNKPLKEKKNLFSDFKSFMKIEHIIFSIPLLLSGAYLGGMENITWSKIIYICLAAIGARTFGMALNRIFDRNIDAVNPRTKMREIPKGNLNLSQAYLISFCGLILYLLNCYLLGPLVLKLSIFPVIPLIFYSLLKRFTSLCHFGIGLTLASAPLCAYIAVTNRLIFSTDLIMLTIFTFFWMSGFDIIYALQDEEFDRNHKVHSLPSSIGSFKSQIVASLSHILAFIVLVVLWLSNGGILSFIFLLISALAFIFAYKKSIPLHIRFFPISAVAGISASLVVLLGG